MFGQDATVGGAANSLMIRPARLADAAGIGEVACAAWQWAYRGILADELLDRLTKEEFSRMWERQLRAPAASTFVLVAEVQGGLIGFVAGGPERDEPSVANQGEIYAINLKPAWVGRGIGRALFSAGSNALFEGGFRRAVLWVLRGNERARRFYEGASWRADGEQRILRDWFPGYELEEVRYACDIAKEARA
jgi:RimJ/RimL family protein N-acetyltransferase